jgi:hypothetical membrane protein
MKLKEILRQFRRCPLSLQMITIILPIFTILVAISIGLYPDFSFIDNHMSALGSSSGNPNGYLYFIVACIITGVLLFPYFFGLRRWRTDDKILNVCLYIVIGIGFIASFGIIMQAIYRTDFWPAHFYWSAVHWAGDALLLMVAPFVMLRHEKFYKPIILVGIVATVFNVYYIATIGQDAWVEWITAISSLVFAALIAINMVKEDL